MSTSTRPERDKLYKLRHSLAHILAQAVLQIRPQAKMGFGPPIDAGFYYDFDFGTEPIMADELKDIEKRMQKIIKEKQEFEAFAKSFDEAVELLGASDQTYKVEYARELVDSGKAEDGKLGFYKNGPFVDMCEGPHLEHTGQIQKGSYSLDTIAGSYWRGSEKNPMLTRIYGLAFECADDLKDYKKRRELARQRDHRKLGRELNLYTIDEEVGVGLPLWLPKGTVIRDGLEQWAREEEFKAGYQRVSTPSITRSQLYYRSGHLPYFAADMFPPMKVDDGEEYYLRPMNCPHHHKVYASESRSYRDLPLRLAEYGDDFRYERHGSLSGLLRVRAMCMNDAHVYCENDQVEAEFTAIMKMYQMYYTHLRIGDLRVRLSLHDDTKDKFVGDEEEWIRSEAIVRDILKNNNIDFEEAPGEAAFYGPKIDIQLSNLLGREETVSTCQLDFAIAERFDLTYIGRDGEDKRPYIIHRAPLSTHERIVSFLIESYGAAFPTWLAPVQVQLIPVADHVYEYAEEIKALMTSKLIRSEIDTSSDSFNKKIRKAVTSKTPNMWILGGNELEGRSVTWRRYSVKEQETMALDTAIDTVVRMNANRVMDNFADVALPVE
jgi:threonyl-tRNA synthetase